jgi:alcohol dehydrogenase
MRAVVFHEHGGVERLRVEEVAEPVARRGDAIVQVRAASLNGFDPMVLAGTTGLKTPLPMIPLGDYAG